MGALPCKTTHRRVSFSLRLILFFLLLTPTLLLCSPPFSSIQVLQYQVHLAAEQTRQQLAAEEAAALAHHQQEQARGQAHTTTTADAGTGQSKFEESAKAAPVEPKKKAGFFW